MSLSHRADLLKLYYKLLRVYEDLEKQGMFVDKQVAEDVRIRGHFTNEEIQTGVLVSEQDYRVRWLVDK